VGAALKGKFGVDVAVGMSHKVEVDVGVGVMVGTLNQKGVDVGVWAGVLVKSGVGVKTGKLKSNKEDEGVCTLTRTGRRRADNVSSPSWPESLAPQQ
jgi:hypothetical protein